MRLREQRRMTAQAAAEKAVAAVGCGYELSSDLRLSHVKPRRLLDLDETLARDLVFPGGITVSGVPASINWDKGERTRFRSDVLSFHQMAEQFNQSLCLSGKIPSGLFNAMFDFRGCWQKDAAVTKSLCFDGLFVELYNVQIVRSPIVLQDQVKQDVPCSWSAAALAEFIEKYGTHVIVGVKMGGKEVIYVKQHQDSLLQQTEVKNILSNLADERFSDDCAGSFISGLNEVPSKLNDLISINIRRGGVNNDQSHMEWLSTVHQFPNVISMSFVPITSLLRGVRGCGFISHAVNLYLRYKPPIEELYQFLEFQLQHQWAPAFCEFPLGPQWKKHFLPSLQFTLMGPKLFVNTVQVDSGDRPVTGIRLYLEGRRNDHLAIHLQHLSALPSAFKLSDDDAPIGGNDGITLNQRAYFEPVKWVLLSHVCTAPVQYNGAHIDDWAAIVTKAWLEVKEICTRKVLFLRLGFSIVASMTIRRSEWDGPSGFPQKSGSISALVSTHFSGGQITPPVHMVEVNSAVFPKAPPVPLRAPRMSRVVDTTEMTRGPGDRPGSWVVTGAKLCVDGGKISLKVKYSLLVPKLEEDL